MCNDHENYTQHLYRFFFSLSYKPSLYPQHVVSLEAIREVCCMMVSCTNTGPASHDSSGGYLKLDTTFRGPYVPVKSKLQHPLPPGHLNFWKIFVQIPPSPGQKVVQMPHHRTISGDQMPPPPGKITRLLNNSAQRISSFTGTWMKGSQLRRLQLLNKI